ncbi:AraC family transcriptional regulator [Paenibacillus tritici]|uniref:AraC family transcriptional regulator n=1 Tax=Paenibacillus tritici TaxID=1873425 RepID=A0ABX2DVI7_9BACL|nr:helix-turn-helix domain-containing protein [Paenibacillus tritici]NQX48714.1 AraC family transcriptional regulator [Paenibacillus tritici]QUL56897.1 helix-turn-helix domain-containing protein [Paenibacillus tritici]
MAEHLQASTGRTLLYSLINIEAVTRSPGGNEPVAVYQEHVLIIVSAGAGWLKADHWRYPLEKGAGFLIEAGSVNRIQAGEQGISFYQLSFEVIRRGHSNHGGVDKLSGEGLLVPGLLNCRPYSQCALLLDSIYYSCRRPEDMEWFAAQTRFQELLLLIIRANAPAMKTKDDREAVERSIRYMEEHFSEALSVDQLAEIAGIGRARYTQLFKEITGQIPLEHLNSLRIEQAQQQLLLTGDRLHEVALAAGYSNEYYFNRRFKATVGVTPGQYRSLHQEGVRVFAPFLEDYLVALGVMPVVQYCHAQWGKQEYLGLDQVPAFDISGGDWQGLSRYRPDLIMLDDGFQRWQLGECRQVAPLFRLPFHQEDWRATLRSAAAVFGRTGRVQEVISDYEQLARQAKRQLSRSIRGQTVALLRISAHGVALYGSENLGYSAHVLHEDLGLQRHPAVQHLTRGQKRVNLTHDELAGLTADHLFITFDLQEGESRELLETQLWRSLPAVRNRCVYEVDFMAWMNYGVLSHQRKIADVLKVLA